jgi:hypothetical protein
VAPLALHNPVKVRAHQNRKSLGPIKATQGPSQEVELEAGPETAIQVLPFPLSVDTASLKQVAGST